MFRVSVRLRVRLRVRVRVRVSVRSQGYSLVRGLGRLAFGFRATT